MMMGKGKCGELVNGPDGTAVKTPILDRIDLLRHQRAEKEQSLAKNEADLEALLDMIRQGDLAQLNNGKPFQERAILKQKATILLDSIQTTHDEIPLLTEAIQRMGETAGPEFLLRAKALCDADRQREFSIIQQLAKAWNEVHKFIQEFKSHRQGHNDQMKRLEDQLRSSNLKPSEILDTKAIGFKPIHIRELSWHLKRCLDVTFSNSLHGNEKAGQFRPEMFLQRASKPHVTNSTNGNQSDRMMSEDFDLKLRDTDSSIIIGRGKQMCSR